MEGTAKLKLPDSVSPAKAGVHYAEVWIAERRAIAMDIRVRGNDGRGRGGAIKALPGGRNYGFALPGAPA